MRPTAASLGGEAATPTASAATTKVETWQMTTTSEATTTPTTVRCPEKADRRCASSRITTARARRLIVAARAIPTQATTTARSITPTAGAYAQTPSDASTAAARPSCTTWPAV